MYGVVNEEGGTARNVRLPGIEVSGKSGTAQVIGYATREKFGKQKKFEDNAWFVGYAPRRNPEIVVAVLVQESGKHGGEAAGPVVKDIIKVYYDKRNKRRRVSTPGEQERCTWEGFGGGDCSAGRPEAGGQRRGHAAGTRQRGAAALKDFMILFHKRRSSRVPASEPRDFFPSFNFRLWTFDFTHERRTGNARLRLVAARHSRRDLRAGRGRNLFRHARQLACGHAHEASALAGYRFRLDVRAFPPGLSSDSRPSSTPLSRWPSSSRRGSSVRAHPFRRQALDPHPGSG